jgi:hypothetical protein
MSADLAWPRYIVGLRHPLLASYGTTLVPAVENMEVEAGPPQQWGVVDSDYRTARIRWYFDSYEARDEFDRWYHDNLLNGTLPFDIELNDGHSSLWWTAMFMGGWEQEFFPPEGWLWMSAQLLLVGDPFTTRDDPAPSAEFDSVFMLRATGTPEFDLRAIFDAQFQLTATPVDASIELEAIFDAQFQMQANGGVGFGVDIEVVFDAQFQMQAVTTESASRVTEDEEERVTEDGEARWTD